MIITRPCLVTVTRALVQLLAQTRDNLQYPMIILLLYIELKKHLQCETLLGLDRKSNKKRRNKKFGECIPTIRYNVIHTFTHVLDIKLVLYLSNPR